MRLRLRWAALSIGLFSALLISDRGDARPAPPLNYSRRTLSAVKTTTPPVIDGDLSDACWKTASKAETFVDSQNGVPVADQTTAYLLYDEKYLYVAFHCRDSRPDQIIAREVVRDSKYQGAGGNDDNVEVNFDPFQSRKWEGRSNFSLNAIGTRSAALAGGRANKVEWQGDWDGAVKRVADGWTAEMRIPWKALNYPSGKQPVTMGVNFNRYQSRTRITSVWSDLGTQGFLEQDGRWVGVQAPQAAFRPHLALLPYLLTGNNHFTPTARTGLDARYTVSPQLTAIGSVNPDFSTIEGALTGISFSRTEKIANETRPFFLEGGDQFGQNGINLLAGYFLSQRITGFDLGAKLYGNLTAHDTLGLLHTIAFGSRNDLAAKLSHSLSATSRIDLFFNQESARNDNNTAAVLIQDTRWGKLSMNTQWALSSGNASGGDAKQVGFIYADKLNLAAFGYGEVTPKFRDADGFVPFTDWRGFIAVDQWGAQWRKGFWRSFYANINPQYQWHTDGRPFQRGASLNVGFEARRDWSVGFDTNYNRFDAQTDNTYGFSFTNNVSNRFRQWGFYVQTGKLGDRPSFFIGPQFSVRVLRKLDIGYNGSLQSLDGITHQQILTFNYELSAIHSVGGRFVIQNGAINWYGFFRNSGGKGMNTYFVLGDPNAARFSSRASFKLVFPM